MAKMNIFQKLSYLSKIQKAVKSIKTALKDAQDSTTFNNITGGINKIADGFNDIKKEVPETAPIMDKLIKVIRDELL